MQSHGNNNETKGAGTAPKTRQPDIMKNADLFNDSNRATYCPEDDKLRLYVGRVPRPEYEALKAEGWTSTPKQDCDFSAVWTPSRYQTCLSYAAIVEDEDMDPAERAADRAERFSGYLERRTVEALDRADAYDSQDQYHGYQSEAKAEKAAAKHDRLGARAVDAWSKAEYWQRRTAGVIGHALHVSSPAVRMGRIKTLESELRKREKDQKDWISTWEQNCKIIADPAPFISHLVTRYGKTQEEAEISVIETVLGSCYQMRHPRKDEGKKRYIFELLKDSDPLTMADFFAHWQAKYPSRPQEETPWTAHLKLRLAYENQMLDAQGGRAASVEMVPGGWLRGGRHLSAEERQIIKVNKSPATGRVVSVEVRDNRPSFTNHWGNPFPDGVSKTLVHVVKVERLPPDAYRPPTEEEAAAYAETQAAAKKAKAASAKEKRDAGTNCPLLNPTDEDAQRLQDLWNERAMDNRREDYKRMFYKGEPTDCPPSRVLRMTQAQYSALSSGSYAQAKTSALCKGGKKEMPKHWSPEREAERLAMGPPVCKVRLTRGKDYGADCVIVISDKPQKPLPPSTWETV